MSIFRAWHDGAVVTPLLLIRFWAIIEEKREKLVAIKPRIKPTHDLEQYERLMTIRHPSFMWMNYGLDSDDFSWLRDDDADWKYQVNMARHNLGGIDLRGKRLLDTGSGRGGNCWYVKRYYSVSRVVGLDQSWSQVHWCNNRFRDSGIDFVCGDSQKPPFAAASFDIVSNIESAAHYPNRRQFYREVHRLLTPSGYFCHSCVYGDCASEERAMQTEGLVLVEKTDITESVVRALKKNDKNVRALMEAITHDEERKRIGRELCDSLLSLPDLLLKYCQYYSWICQRPPVT